MPDRLVWRAAWADGEDGCLVDMDEHGEYMWVEETGIMFLACRCNWLSAWAIFELQSGRQRPISLPRSRKRHSRHEPCLVAK